MLTKQRTEDRGKGAWRSLLHRRRDREREAPAEVAMSRDDRLIWLGIAVVAGVDGGLLAGLLTAVAGGTKQVALGAGGVAALGTFGTVLTVIRFLHNPTDK